MSRVVFVVGMHRSGTSAVSGALRFCGFSHGNALMPPRDDNPDGFWEQLPVVRLNDRILDTCGARWDRIPLWLDFESLAPRDFGAWAAGSFGDAAAAAWDEAFGGVEGDLVCKDPRLALTLPLWLRTAEAKGYSPEVVFTHRASEMIVASLTRRNGIEFAQAAELIVDHWMAMLQAAPKGARVVSYERLANNPVQALGSLGFAPASEEARRELREFVAPRPSLPATGVVPKPFLPPALRMLEGALAGAQGACLLDASLGFLKPVAREREAHKRYAGQTSILPPEEVRAAFRPRVKRRRTVVLHCHIFKNAGSSVDVLLRENFGARWAEKEFPAKAGFSNADLTNSFLRASDAHDAVSTHTGDWWLGHSDEELTVLPVIFLRHPLLRIRSAYSFERKQQADTLGAQLAKAHDFPGYVRARLDRPRDFAFRDFQARRLAAFHARVTTDLRSTAFRALDRAPFVGLVEDFDGSARRLESYLRSHFDGFRAYETRANTTDTSEAGEAEKVQRLAGELGEALFEELRAANEVDIAVYEEATSRWAAPGTNSVEEASL